MANQHQLTPQQRDVLTQLLAGETQRAAAATAHVAEETVSRWINHDAAFIAAYNQGRRALHEASLDRLLNLRMRAAERLAQLVDADDPKVALRAIAIIFRHTAVPAGEVDAAEIEMAQRDRERSRKSDERLAEFIDFLG